MGWLSWRWGLGGAIVAGALWLILIQTRPRHPTLRWLASAAREFAILSGLYAVWNLGGRIDALGVDQAFDRGEWLYNLQLRVGLPDEALLQDMILPYPWLVRASNFYYAIAHVPAMIAALIWMFLYHRPSFGRFRTQLALFTGSSLVIQLVAVAPPRFVSATGMVDTGILYNQSVYSALGRESVGQLQAMPSIHVGWAIFVGAACVWFSPHWWLKAVGVAHAVLTSWVVMVTANHFWADGIVAAAIMVFWFYVLRSLRPTLGVRPKLLARNEPTGLL